MEKYDSPAEVCEYVPGMTETLLAQLRYRGDGPAFVKVGGRKIAYRRSAVEAWLQSRERQSTRDPVGA